MIITKETVVLAEFNKGKIMKTRIISGAVLILLVAAVILGSVLISPMILTAFIAIIAGIAIYELLGNAVGIKSKPSLFGACIYVASMVFILDRGTKTNIELLPETSLNIYDIQRFALSIVISIIYFIFAVIMSLVNHRDSSHTRIFSLCAIPIPVAFAFSFLGTILNYENGIYYLLLLLNFSSICDIGAYFVGSSIGKHKLCPSISPNKTIEGAIGGIAFSLIITFVLVFSFGFADKLIVTLLLTVPFCILGMIGDLFASAIKRLAGIKDYGKIIPGHGGILDRFDSIIMIAPLVYVFIVAGII